METGAKPKKSIGNEEPEDVGKASYAIAKGILAEREDRKAAIKEFSQGFPILYQLIRFSDGLGWTGTASKRWAQFSEVYADFMQLANLLYDKYEDEYTKLYPDSPREERIWFMMCDKMRNVVEDLNALAIAIMPTLKQEIELRAESKERETFLQVLRPEERGKGRTSTRMKRQFEKAQYEEED